MINEKKKKKAEDAAALREYFRNLKVCEAAEKTKILTEACKVPPHTFANWRSGMAAIPELAKDKIEEVAGIIIFKR